MSDEQILMKFEYLPNEIIINCFEYLNGPDIFYAFEQLNYRFDKLTRTIPLYLDFQDIPKSIFDRFCKTILINPMIQRQIYSLRLSNKNTHGQIHAFLTYFSFNQLTQLRSLTLIDVKENNFEELSLIFPLLSELIDFRLIDSFINTDKLIFKLPMSKSNIFDSSFQDIIPLRKLSIDYLNFDHLYQILYSMPLLQYLSVSRTSHNTVVSTDINLLIGRVNHLKHLIITNFSSSFDDLINFIKCMSNLRSLTVSGYEKSDMIDAFRWKKLITSSLPHLILFKFKFATFNQNEILDKYQQFQSEFWIKEHQWYTECLLGGTGVSYIFTIPYLTDSRTLWLKYVRHWNKSINNNIDTFNHVKQLGLLGEKLNKLDDFYFPNIISLIIQSLPVIDNEDDEEKFFKSLERIINLSNIEHLLIPICCETKRPTILLKILKAAPHLSSLNIHRCATKILKTNQELCQYTSQMIKKLEFGVYYQSHACDNKYTYTNLIYEIFPNIEQLICYVVKLDESLLFFKNLSKLSMLTLDFHLNDIGPLNRVKDQLSTFDNVFFYEDLQYVNAIVIRAVLGVWVNRNHINT
jgi:hypothetical protein